VLSGTWTGYMGRSETERQPVTVTLKFDGKSVTGRITGPPYPGDIKTGSFDAATGALKLEVTVLDDNKTIVWFEGKVTNGNAVGSVVFKTGTRGIFSITRQGAGTQPAAPAASPRTAAPAKRTPEQIQASYEAHKGDFDYLLGDWEYTAESKEYGKFRGYWSAVRLDEGQILDEYRVVGDKGETFYVTTSLRNYNRMMDRWELIGADAGAGLQDFGTARRVGTEMHIEQKFGVATDEPSVWRIRYFNIKPDSFSWTADRSTDGGKTWVKDHQRIEARRIGPSRKLEPLAPARKVS
jgi:hypothetical protein